MEWCSVSQVCVTQSTESVRKMDESAKGTADGQHCWNTYQVRTAFSAVLAWLEYCFDRHMEAGMELSTRTSYYCRCTTQFLHTSGAVSWVSSTRPPLSDCSRLNSALLQCRHAFFVTYRYRRISLTDWVYLAGTGFICRDWSRLIRSSSDFNIKTEEFKRHCVHIEDRGESKRGYETHITQDPICCHGEQEGEVSGIGDMTGRGRRREQ